MMPCFGYPSIDHFMLITTLSDPITAHEHRQLISIQLLLQTLPDDPETESEPA